MSTFKDIIDTISSLEGECVDQILTSKKHQSLSKMSKEGIMNFPVLVSDALTIEDASLVSKALEKQFASFTLIAMTMNPYLTVQNGNQATASNYVNKFHQNIDVKGSSTDLINAINTFTEEALNKFDMEYSTLEGLEEFMTYAVYENCNCHSINKENMRFSYTIQDVTESSILNNLYNRRITNTHRPILEADDTGFYNRVGDNSVGSNVNYKNTGDNSTGANAYSVGNNSIGHGAVVTQTTMSVDGINSGDIGRSIGRELARGQRASTARGQQQLKHLTDNDAKKANELVPTLLHMRIYPTDKEGNEYPAIDFVIGIKATLHPIDSTEMITNLCRGVKNENTFFNFIRWTTGEIRFMKDFVLSMNELKIDALNSSNKASKWWTMLKRRKALARIKNVVVPNKLVPNATIIVTQDEVNTIKEVYGYDLTNAAVLDKLMANYFLLSFVIVDPALQRVKFMFDGSTQFETLTYATLARESSTNDKQFKEMLNMLGRRM